MQCLNFIFCTYRLFKIVQSGVIVSLEKTFQYTLWKVLQQVRSGKDGSVYSNFVTASRFCNYIFKLSYKIFVVFITNMPFMAVIVSIYIFMLINFHVEIFAGRPVYRCICICNSFLIKYIKLTCISVNETYIEKRNYYFNVLWYYYYYYFFPLTIFRIGTFHNLQKWNKINTNTYQILYKDTMITVYQWAEIDNNTCVSSTWFHLLMGSNKKWMLINSCCFERAVTIYPELLKL